MLYVLNIIGLGHTRPWPESKINEFKPRLKSVKNMFHLSADLNPETLNAILNGTYHI